MKNFIITFESTARNRERGSVAILIAFMWTALFGMAVVAVDFGYLYTKRRNLQAAADAAVTAGMPRILATDQPGATARALAMANTNGFSGGDIVTNTATATDLTVTLQRQYPTFFGSVLGMTPKTLQATSIGRLTAPPPSGGAAIYAGDPSGVCAGGAGFTVQGQGQLNITGDVASPSKIEFGFMDFSICTSATCRVTGNVLTPCGGQINDPVHFGVSGSSAPAAPGADPLSANTLASLAAFCTIGGVGVARPLVNADWTAGVGCDTLNPGVYCSNGLINVAPPFNPGICPSNVTFISAQTVIIGAAGNISLTAAPGVPNGIIAYADGAGAGCGVPAINMGFGNAYVINGSVYAPNGCVNGGGGPAGFTMNGTLDGRIINLGIANGSVWNLSGGGGGPGPPITWHLYR